MVFSLQQINTGMFFKIIMLQIHR